MSETIEEALKTFDSFNQNGKAILSIVSPAMDNDGKSWKYQAFLFFPKEDGLYSDAECFSNDLASAIVSCVDVAETVILQQMVEEL